VSIAPALVAAAGRDNVAPQRRVGQRVSAGQSEFRSGGIGIRSCFPLVAAFSAANRFPLRRKML
jgi:hypothetical protein